MYILMGIWWILERLDRKIRLEKVNFSKLEQKFLFMFKIYTVLNQILILIGYLSISHSGLSENELQDILSLDDDLLEHYLSKGLIKIHGTYLRMPWFLILPLLNSISTYLLVKPFYGINTFWWKHKIFNDVIFKKYLGNHFQLFWINCYKTKHFHVLLSSKWFGSLSISS